MSYKFSVDVLIDLEWNFVCLKISIIYQLFLSLNNKIGVVLVCNHTFLSIILLWCVSIRFRSSYMYDIYIRLTREDVGETK